MLAAHKGSGPSFFLSFFDHSGQESTGTLSDFGSVPLRNQFVWRNLRCCNDPWHDTCLRPGEALLHLGRKPNLGARFCPKHNNTTDNYYMKNPWTMALVGAGLVSLPAIIQAEE